MKIAVPLPELLTEAEAAKRLGVSAATMQRERKRRRIRHVIIGGRPRYTADHLAEYLTAQEVAPCREADTSTPARSPAIGLASGRTAGSGAGPGTILTLDRLAEHRSALTILQPQKSRLPSGSPRTSPPSAPSPATSRSPACSSDIRSGTASTWSAPDRSGSALP
ncbi:helix-turn-helix domain-containing protein [Roseomonas tokyonensis]|nr:helix-turn-helix domain-containing protein [Falsiroseomonas tokyonensis]